VTYLASALVVMVFVMALEGLGVTRVAAEAVSASRGAAKALGDRSLSDDEKERAVRRASVALFGKFLVIGLRSAGAVLLSLLPLFAFDLLGLTTIDAVTDWLASLTGICWMSVLVVVWILARRFL